MPIIETSNLTKHYPRADRPQEQFTAVNALNLMIDEGEIFGIHGPSGACKTTTFEMIEGLFDIDEGEIRVDGVDVMSRPYDV